MLACGEPVLSDRSAKQESIVQAAQRRLALVNLACFHKPPALAGGN